MTMTNPGNSNLHNIWRFSRDETLEKIREAGNDLGKISVLTEQAHRKWHESGAFDIALDNNDVSWACDIIASGYIDYRARFPAYSQALICAIDCRADSQIVDAIITWMEDGNSWETWCWQYGQQAIYQVMDTHDMDAFRMLINRLPDNFLKNRFEFSEEFLKNEDIFMVTCLAVTRCGAALPTTRTLLRLAIEGGDQVMLEKCMAGVDWSDIDDIELIDMFVSVLRGHRPEALYLLPTPRIWQCLHDNRSALIERIRKIAREEDLHSQPENLVNCAEQVVHWLKSGKDVIHPHAAFDFLVSVFLICRPQNPLPHRWEKIGWARNSLFRLILGFATDGDKPFWNSQASESAIQRKDIVEEILSLLPASLPEAVINGFRPPARLTIRSALTCLLHNDLESFRSIIQISQEYPANAVNLTDQGVVRKKWGGLIEKKESWLYLVLADPFSLPETEVFGYLIGKGSVLSQPEMTIIQQHAMNELYDDKESRLHLAENLLQQTNLQRAIEPASKPKAPSL